MNIIRAFLSRDITIERTYRFHLALKFSGIVMQLVIFFFISRFLRNPGYFMFVFVGLAFSGFFQFWLNVFAENVRQEQYWGTLEHVFLSPGRPLALLLSSASWKFIVLAIEIAFLLVLGKQIFGYGFSLNLILFIPLFILNSIAMGGIGLLSGSFVMYFKRGDPVNWALGAVIDLLSGIYFPVAMFPDIMKDFSEKLPTTSALNMWRDILIFGRTPELSRFAVQAAWAFVLFAAGAWAFKAAYNKTREKGDLGNY